MQTTMYKLWDRWDAKDNVNMFMSNLFIAGDERVFCAGDNLFLKMNMFGAAFQCEWTIHSLTAEDKII